MTSTTRRDTTMKLIAEKVYHKFSDVHMEQSDDSAKFWRLICLNSLGLQRSQFFCKFAKFLVKLSYTILKNMYTSKKKDFTTIVMIHLARQ